MYNIFDPTRLKTSAETREIAEKSLTQLNSLKYLFMTDPNIHELKYTNCDIHNSDLRKKIKPLPNSSIALKNHNFSPND